jgi:tRNA (guanine-N7-)-methyltransferase
MIRMIYKNHLKNREFEEKASQSCLCVKSTDLRIPFVWAERRPILLDRFLYVPGYYDRHEEWTVVSWSDPQIFGNDLPVMIEYCSGNGQWICERAEQNPHLNWVAVEKRLDRSRKIWAKLHQKRLLNLYVVCGDAKTVTSYYFPKKKGAEIFVNFPDPWPKLRHAKHRLIQAPFLEEVEKVLLPGGKAMFVTDDSTYVAQMIKELALCLVWRPCLPDPHYELNQSNYGASFFADLWKMKGRDIYFLPYCIEE